LPPHTNLKHAGGLGGEEERSEEERSEEERTPQTSLLRPEVTPLLLPLKLKHVVRLGETTCELVAVTSWLL
jgi:hypothetical protein